MKSAAYFFQIKAKIIVKTSDETQRNENNSLQNYVVPIFAEREKK